MKQSLFLVAGLGKTGLSIARYLQRKNLPFIAFDTRLDVPGLKEFQHEFPKSTTYLAKIPADVIQQVTDVIASPGIPLETECIVDAKKLGALVYGDIECLAREITAPVIAITGTNGKSTVTAEVGEMAREAGYKVAVGGNIGTPVLDLLTDGTDYDLWVLELSSFQLDLTHSLKPRVATILNVTPDHLDRHHTMDAYIDAKQRIYNNAEVAVFNREDKATVPRAEFHVPEMISFGQDKPQDGNWGLLDRSSKTEPRASASGPVQSADQIHLAKGNECYFPVNALLLKGTHNWLNTMAAIALAEAAGFPVHAIHSVLKTFAGLDHRCQWVRSINNVDYINDSKGTNIGASLSAIKGIGGSMQGKIILIAGGQGKGADFTEMRDSIMDYVRTLVLIGEDAAIMEKALVNTVPITRANSLESAVDMAKAQAKPGDVVLLSPACASLDMFRDFNHRGEVFTNYVNGMQGL